MSNPAVVVLGSDYPKCVEPGCGKLAQDGYCRASCCFDKPREETPRCYEHSHRRQLVLDALGFDHRKTEFSRSEVDDLIDAMWTDGAASAVGAHGYLQMLRDLRAKRLREGCDACRNWSPLEPGALVSVSTCANCGRVRRAERPAEKSA